MCASNPEVGRAGVEDDLEGLGRSADGDLANVGGVALLGTSWYEGWEGESGGRTAHLVDNIHANSLPCTLCSSGGGLVTILLAKEVGMDCESLDRGVAVR